MNRNRYQLSFMAHLLWMCLVACIGVCNATDHWENSVQPTCDLTQSPAKYCQDYCTGSCNFHNKSLGETGAPTNMTLYRLTPKNVLGIANHNTGDVPGDVGFVLANRRKVLECLQNETSRGCFLDNSTDNIYGAFDIEINGEIGPYFQCNPLYQNASNPFQCWQKWWVCNCVFINLNLICFAFFLQ